MHFSKIPDKAAPVWPSRPLGLLQSPFVHTKSSFSKTLLIHLARTLPRLPPVSIQPRYLISLLIFLHSSVMPVTLASLRQDFRQVRSIGTTSLPSLRCFLLVIFHLPVAILQFGCKPSLVWSVFGTEPSPMQSSSFPSGSSPAWDLTPLTRF